MATDKNFLEMLRIELGAARTISINAKPGSPGRLFLNRSYAATVCYNKLSKGIKNSIETMNLKKEGLDFIFLKSGLESTAPNEKEGRHALA